jgi:hypothetical protein
VQDRGLFVPRRDRKTRSTGPDNQPNGKRWRAGSASVVARERHQVAGHLGLPDDISGCELRGAMCGSPSDTAPPHRLPPRTGDMTEEQQIQLAVNLSLEMSQSTGTCLCGSHRHLCSRLPGAGAPGLPCPPCQRPHPTCTPRRSPADGRGAVPPPCTRPCVVAAPLSAGGGGGGGGGGGERAAGVALPPFMAPYYGSASATGAASPGENPSAALRFPATPLRPPPVSRRAQRRSASLAGATPPAVGRSRWSAGCTVAPWATSQRGALCPLGASLMRVSARRRCAWTAVPPVPAAAPDLHTPSLAR